MNNKQLFNKRHGGILPGSIVNPILPGSNNDNTDVLDEIDEDTSMTNNSVEYDSENNISDLDNSSGDSVDVNGVVSGLWKLSSFKTKLIIIGIIAAFVSLVIFLILFITPLMNLGIIEIKGASNIISYSPFSSVSPSYSYCDSINVEGKLYDLEEYVAGVVQAEVGMFINDPGAGEALKALSIAARTYAIYYTNGCKKSIKNSDEAQTFISNPNNSARQIANSTAGLVLSYNNDLFLSEYDSLCTRCSDFTLNSDGSYSVTYTKPPTGDKHVITFDDSTYMDFIVDGKDHGHGRGMSQYVAVQYSKEGLNYQDILNTFYSDGVEIVNIRKLQVGNVGTEQGLDYIGTYTNVKNGKTYKNYKQYLYRGDDFTFEGKDHLASVGCGTNSAAIILSGEDSSITPMTLYIENNRQVGTYFGNHYSYRKDSFSYCKSWNNGYCTKTNDNTKLSNSDMKDKLIINLSNGGTAILFINYSADKCMVRGESWTGSQHFFTVLDYNPADNTIYISNPGTNNSSHNGWISIDDFKCVHVAWLMYPE